MAFKDLLNAKQNREKAEQLEKFIEENNLTDYFEVQEKMKAAQQALDALIVERDNIQTQVDRLTENASGLSQDIESMQSTLGLYSNLNELKSEIKLKQSQLLIADDELLMESFALYRPRYSFATVDEYKEKLTANRQSQKEMIKNGVAATGAQNWRVNDSLAQGRKLVNDMIKLCLRSFNNECEATIADVKFNNFDRCKERITKSADAIEKLGKIMSVSLRPAFIQLKIDELSLALEYQIKKQEEKEHLSELRAQQREAAKVAKELEEARKESLKEQHHYERALDMVKKQIDNCTDKDELSILMEKCDELKEKLLVIVKEIEQIDYREANQRAGYVYVISNIGAFGKDVYKIGMTRRLDPQERVDELGDASVPFRFDVHAMIFSDDAPTLETALHKAFADRRLNFVNNRREFFRVPLDEIKRVVKANHDKSVEFIDTPLADQYHESEKMRELASRC